MVKNRLRDFVSSVIGVVDLIPLHGFMAYRTDIIAFGLNSPGLFAVCPVLKSNAVSSMFQARHKPYLLEPPEFSRDSLTRQR
jgi:hypothetical protein